MARKVIRYSIIFILFVLCFVYALPGWSDSIVLKERAAVSGNWVRLKDIIDTDKSIVSERMLDMPIIQAPAAGRQVQLSKQAVIAKLFPFLNGGNLTVRGEGVRITNGERLASKEEIIAAANDALKEMGYKVIDESVAAMFVPKGADIEVELADETGAKRLAYICVEGVRRQAVYVQKADRQTVKAWVAARDIAAGDVIRQDDVMLAEIEGGIKGVLAEGVGLVGMTARSAVKKGQPILRKNLRRDFLVKANDAVDVIVKREGFVLKTKGIAKQAGRKGDIVRVANMDTKKVFYAEVLDKGVVEVEI